MRSESLVLHNCVLFIFSRFSFPSLARTTRRRRLSHIRYRNSFRRKTIHADASHNWFSLKLASDENYLSCRVVFFPSQELYMRSIRLLFKFNLIFFSVFNTLLIYFLMNFSAFLKNSVKVLTLFLRLPVKPSRFFYQTIISDQDFFLDLED